MRNNKKLVGSIIILIVFCIFLAVGYFISRPSKVLDSKEVFNETNVVSNSTANNKEVKDITVYINGEVKKPGVYKLKDRSRTEDLVKVAGGFTENADKDKLNLAKKLKDEDYIYVEKTAGEKSDAVNPQASSSVSSDGKVNINTASKEELKTVPGIGDVTAQKIIDYREKNGGFSSIEDLKKVGRIGDKTLEKMKDKIEVR
jgi:competence protein ComEA